MSGETYTITFTECSENHVGMQKIGKILDEGVKIEDLIEVVDQYKNTIYKDNFELYNLNINDSQEPAGILIIRNALDIMNINHVELYNEHKNLNVDKKAFMRGRVVNKIARWNLCFADFNQEPNYEQSMGRVIDFKTLNLTNLVKENLPNLIGSKISSGICTAEGNYYYNNKCGIGYHGDSERKKVIGLRLGDTMNLCFRWYLNSQIISDTCTLYLNSGDMYIMSEKATGNDWKRRSIQTLRHAAGADKYVS